MGILKIILALAFVFVGSVLAHLPTQIETLNQFPSAKEILTEGSDGFAAVSSERLPTTVLPVDYVLEFVPILDNGLGNKYKQWTVPGKVTITVKADVEDIQAIVLNAHEDLAMDLAGIKVVPFDSSDETEFKVDATRDVAKELLILNLDKALTDQNVYKIYIEFTALILDETATHGIFRSSFNDKDGGDSTLAATFLCPTGARRAFPCFDEPNLKAIFKISVAYGPKYIALGNNEIKETLDFGAIGATGWKINHFKPTVAMSTYLVAFAVAPQYDYVQATPESDPDAFKKPARIYGPAHLISTANGGLGGGLYPADQATKLMTVFERYTGLKYSLEKIDSIAISTFEGAMENWGLNTYKTDYLMYYPGVSTEAERLLTTQILSHELIHQWFGNLVTSEFWDQIWLNEGFADFFQFYGTNAVQPNLKALEHRQFASLQVGLKAEASLTAQPLVNNVAKPGAGSKLEDYMKVFTTYNTYQKGGSLLRMLEALLTPASFQAGLRTYLTQYQLKTVKQDALFEILTTQGRADGTLPPDVPSIEDIMNTWTLQSGFPLVRVSKATDDNIYISQERFTYHVEYNHEHELDLNDLWTIPVAVASEVKNSNFEVLTPEFWIYSDVAVTGYTHDTTKWIVLNANSVGFYRVLYDIPLFKNLLNVFNRKDSAISILSRAEILDDYFTFVEYDYTDVENALELTKSLTWEINAVVWDTVLKHFKGYSNKLSENTVAFTAFKNYLEPKLEAAIDAIAEDNSKGMTVILRSKLLDWVCSLGNLKCRELATFLFNQWTKSPVDNPIPVDIAPVVFCGAIAKDTAAFAVGFTKYKESTTTPKDKLYLVKAFGCSSDVVILNTLQGHILGARPVITDRKHRLIVLKSVASNSISRYSSIDFVNTNAPEIVADLGVSAIVEYVKTLSEFVGTEAGLAKITTMITIHEALLKDVKSDLEKYVKVIQDNIKWTEVYCKVGACRLQKWFEVANLPPLPFQNS